MVLFAPQFLLVGLTFHPLAAVDVAYALVVIETDGSEYFDVLGVCAMGPTPNGHHRDDELALRLKNRGCVRCGELAVPNFARTVLQRSNVSMNVKAARNPGHMVCA